MSPRAFLPTGGSTARPGAPRTRTRPRLRLGLTLLLGTMAPLAPGPARAQVPAPEVTFRGHADPEVDALIRRFLEQGGYVLLDRDTVLQTAVQGPLLVLDATVSISTVVEGNVLAVGANLFVRPSARIHGHLISAGGGLYRSDLAQVSGQILSRPLAPYSVERQDSTYTIVAVGPRRNPLFLPGSWGFEIPTYDRVNGLDVGWGVGLRAPQATFWRPELVAIGRYFSQRGELGGRLALSLGIGTVRVEGGVDKGPVTNEEWIRTGIGNAISYLVKQADDRDYYGATRSYAQIQRDVRVGAVDGSLRLRAQREDATSLVAGAPWGLFKRDSIPPNPPIDDGVTSSLILDGDGSWIDSSSEIDAGATLEWAGRVAGGQFAFARYVARADVAFNTFRRQTLRLRIHAQGPLPGTESLPAQRWSFVGGRHTLYTFDRAQFRGDRVVFLETLYRIPLPQRLALPVIGAPSLELLHNAGMAWTSTGNPDFEQNIGASLQFFSLFFRYMVDPADPGTGHDFSVGLKWPFGSSYPWEARGGGLF